MLVSLDFLPRARCVLWIFCQAGGWRSDDSRRVGFAGQRGTLDVKPGGGLFTGESVAWGLLTVNSTGVVIIRMAGRKMKRG